MLEKSNKFMSKRENPLETRSRSHTHSHADTQTHILLKLERVNKAHGNVIGANEIVYCMSVLRMCVASSLKWPQNVVKTFFPRNIRERGRDKTSKITAPKRPCRCDKRKRHEKFFSSFIQEWFEARVKMKRNCILVWHRNTHLKALHFVSFTRNECGETES